jgi:hypothetical protein
LFPGFYVTDAAQGIVVPQFYPLHPVWQAVAFGLSPSAVAGTEAALLLSGLWMTLAGLAIVLIGRELGGRPAVLLLLPALALTALQVWFARYPTTEALTQYMLWAGLWALVRWFGGRQHSSLWAFLAGAALGSVFLVRIDLLILLPIFGLFVFALWFRGWQTADTWFVVPFAVLVAHSFAHGLLFSAPYFYETVGFGLRLLRVNWWIPGAGLLAALGVFWMAWIIRKRESKFARFRRPLLLSLIAAFLLFAIYNWFIRPYSSAAIVRPDAYSDTLLLLTNHENFLRLGWYLALPGIWLGVAGICWMVWKVDSRTAVLLAVGLSFTVVYIWNIRANPHQVYVMRRYVPAVVPFFLLAAAVLISSIDEQGRLLSGVHVQRGWLLRGAALVLGVLWLMGLGWSARGFVRQVDYEGLLEQLAALEAQLPPEAILLFDDQQAVSQGDFWGTPLTYIFGHDAYTIRDVTILEGPLLAETIEIWQNNGRSVVWFGDPAWLVGQGFPFQEKSFSIDSRRLESSYVAKPQQVIQEKWDFRAAFLEGNP